MAGPFDLTGQNIENTYQRVLQTDGTYIYNGTGSLINSLNATASHATTASYVLNAVSSSFALTASFVRIATTASYALAARFIIVEPSSSAAIKDATGLSKFFPLFGSARNGGDSTVDAFYVNSGSFQYIMGTNTLTVTSSYANQTLSSSFASTSSFAPNAIVTASVSSNTITFTKGNGTTFPITVNTGSGGGGATSPGGSNTQIQYNNAGAFGGVPNLTWNGTTLNATGSFSGSFAGVYIPITVTAIDTVSGNYSITNPGTYIVQSADPTFTYAMVLPDPRYQPIGSEIKIVNMDGANNLTFGNPSPYDLAGSAIGALAPQLSLKLVCFNIDGTTVTNKWYSI